MNNSSFFNILNHPNQNGLTLFVLGIMFILSVYHFFLYFQHKDKSYLYYSSYTLLIFIGLLNRPTNGFIVSIIKPFKDILDHINLNLILNYNLMYFIFILTLLDMKIYSKKWNSYIVKSIIILFIYSVLLEIWYLLTDNITIIIKGHNFFTISIYLLGLIILIPMIKMKNPLKIYIIVGSLFLLVTSLFVTIIKRLDISDSEKEIRYSIFFIGLVLENILFSLALGAKQKTILEDKNISQEKLIKQLKENEKLKREAHYQLEQNVVVLSQQAKEEKFEKVKAKYEKELTELKMLSLRSQMNPHFLFNSLNSIKLYIINNEKENAVYYLNKFSKLIRNILAITQEKEINLAYEIETMELYLKIENIRFKNEIEYDVKIDDNLNINTITIPCLILQPFLENAIWHGLSLKKGLKKLIVQVENKKPEYVKISIIDNGIGRIRSKELNKQKLHKKNSVGIKLTKLRLKNFFKNYQNKGALEIIDLYDNVKKPRCTKITLRIPLK